MTRHRQIIAAVVLAVALLAGLASSGAAAEIIVTLASVSDSLPPASTPAVGASCAESLKALKLLGLRIIDVKGSAQLVYTLQRDALLGRPAAVAVIFCAPAEEAK